MRLDTDLVSRLHVTSFEIFFFFYSTHCQLDDFVEKDLFVSKEVKHKILTDTKEREKKESSAIKWPERLRDELWIQQRGIMDEI